ncbi:MAG: zinc-binding dehydrogenase, partial [Acidimicrobiia bacterium]
PRCAACEVGQVGRCERIGGGHLKPGLQTGYCTDTGGGWSTALVAHTSQLHVVPDALSDEDAVMVEPTACAVHAVHRLTGVEMSSDPGRVAVIGAGTIGLCTIAALRQTFTDVAVIAAARHPHQRRLARELGAEVVVGDDENVRVARRFVGTSAVGDGSIERLTGGVDATIDCVGSAETIATARSKTRPGGRVVLAGMPGHSSVDLTPLWQREIELTGAYAYGHEAASDRRTFDLAVELVRDAGLGRLVSATYPLHRFAEALAHAAEAGRRGAVKIAFDLRQERD